MTVDEERDKLKEALRPFGMLMSNVFTDADGDTAVKVSFIYDGINFDFVLKYRDFMVARDPMNPDAPAW